MLLYKSVHNQNVVVAVGDSPTLAETVCIFKQVIIFQDFYDISNPFVYQVSG